MRSVDVEGATGNISTNFAGKGMAAIDEFKNGQDYVYIHVEAPDECGHRAELDNKILSVEKIDELILKPVYEYLKGTGEDFKILVLPDHPTPICKRTHTMDPVPFIMYDSAKDESGIDCYCEETAKQTGLYISKGENLMELFINGNLIK
jgi:2,3-bisphosphoglycerate-independent phosphoglycerate mutase